MRCSRCFSHMQLSRRENHRDSSLEWHECPVCQRMEFLSLPVTIDMQLSSDTALAEKDPAPLVPV